MVLGKVLVTGAAGLLGSYVVNELANKAEIFGLDMMLPNVPDQFSRFVQGSIEDIDVVRDAVNGCDMVIHVAARPNIWSGEGHEIVRTNVTGTWNVLQAAEDAGLNRSFLT